MANNLDGTFNAITLTAQGAGTVNSNTFTNPTGKGVILYLNITAVTGTAPTLDIKVQAISPITGLFYDINLAAFAQKSATGQDMLILYPTVAAAANKAVATVLPFQWRLAVTVGGTTPSFTATVTAEILPY